MTLARAALAAALALAACRPSAPRPAAPARPDAARPAASSRAPDASHEAMGCVSPGAVPQADGGVTFTERDWRRIRRMSPVPPVPADPTNRVADDPRAAALGRALFDDTGLSRRGDVACASCHAAPHRYADLRPLAVAGDPPRRGRRNVPSLEGSAHKRWQTWDASADSLWAQPALAFENPLEHDLTRVRLAELVLARHGDGYRAVFGDGPDLANAQRFPRDARTGSPAWRAMAEADRDAVNRVVANVGKALAAYERTLSPGPAPFDRWVAGDASAMSAEAVRGLGVFLRVGCIRCHSGPMFSDGEPHVARFPDDVAVGPDRGAVEGLARARASDFYGRGRYSDAPDHPFPIEAPDAEQRGRFVTPTLRGVADTAPYGHAGTLATLDDVVRLYARGGLPVGDARTQGGDDPFLAPFAITDDEVRALVAFLRALGAERP